MNKAFQRSFAILSFCYATAARYYGAKPWAFQRGEKSLI